MALTLGQRAALTNEDRAAVNLPPPTFRVDRLRRRRPERGHLPIDADVAAALTHDAHTLPAGLP
jgi:hypothetical protein